MRLLLLSDIHSNIEALNAVLEAAPEYDRVVNLGDIVGYNASPNEVCERVRAMGGLVVRGNHDRACSGLTDLSEFNLIAAMSARWTQTVLSEEHTAWLRDLPEGPLREDKFPSAEFVHGSPRDEDEYVLSTPTAAADLQLPDHREFIFFGHTHLQGGFIYDAGRTQAFVPTYEEAASGVLSWTMALRPRLRYMINPGSVGQPRDNDWRAAFALYEANEAGLDQVTFFRVPYHVEQTQAKVLAANLPERLATRLGLGR